MNDDDGLQPIRLEVDEGVQWGRVLGVLLFLLAFTVAALFMVWLIVTLLRAIF